MIKQKIRCHFGGVFSMSNIDKINHIGYNKLQKITKEGVCL